ncbi:MAG: PaaI family thioesterase [Candidatus Hodarchaeota archaeon]
MASVDYSSMLKEGYVRVQRDYPVDYVPACFGCSPTNPIGMRLQFFTKPGDKYVVTRYVVEKHYCGFPAFAHGGIIGLIFDEVMAYTTYNVFKKFGLTKQIEMKFIKPVLIGKPMFIRGWVHEVEEKGKKRYVNMEAELYEGNDETGKLCAKSNGIYVIPPDETLSEGLKEN